MIFNCTNETIGANYILCKGNMTTTTVSAYEVRRNLSELMELAYYKNAQIKIERNSKPMARLVGEPFMAVIEKLLADDPALAETISIMLAGDMMAAIETGTKEVKAGKTIPIEKALQDKWRIQSQVSRFLSLRGPICRTVAI